MAVRMYWRQKRGGDVGEGAVRMHSSTGLSEEDVHGMITDELSCNLQ